MHLMVIIINDKLCYIMIFSQSSLKNFITWKKIIPCLVTVNLTLKLLWCSLRTDKFMDFWSQRRLSSFSCRIFWSHCGLHLSRCKKKTCICLVYLQHCGLWFVLPLHEPDVTFSGMHWGYQPITEQIRVSYLTVLWVTSWFVRIHIFIEPRKKLVALKPPEVRWQLSLQRLDL